MSETAYLIKYALRNGKIVRDTVMSSMSGADPDWVYLSSVPYNGVRMNKEAFSTEEDAMKGADAARNKKIASLMKQIEKLKAMKFTVVDA